MALSIVIAPDKFKGSLSSFAVCDAIETGLLQASPSFEIKKLPMADGGDGLADVIRYYTQASVQTAIVQNPLGKPVAAEWLLSADGKTAVIEMAKASGLGLLKKEEYNPLLTSTFGTGQLIKAAIQSGAGTVVLGIGGSATNDGGTGMAAALGFRFLDEKGTELAPIGKNLVAMKTIDARNAMPLNKIRFQVACDVKNVLYGEDGASRIYGPQKGADAATVEALDKGMMNYAMIVKRDLDTDVSSLKGGGAAGGMGAGCAAFLKAELISGADLVMGYASVEEHIRSADVIITGEGKVDEQTLQGKLVASIAALGKKHHKKIIVVCGVNELSIGQVTQLNVDGIFSIRDKSKDIREAIENAGYFLTCIGRQIGFMLRNSER